MSEPAASQGLKAAIGRPGAVMLVIGGMIGVGVFVNPAVVARSVHEPLPALAAWGAGGVISLLGAFVYAELAARIPETGGEYQYLRAAYGPLLAFLFGWTTLLVVQAGGMAAVAIVFAGNVGVLIGRPGLEPWTVAATLAALAIVNCLGVKAGDRAQASLGAVKVAAIGGLILAGMALAPAGAALVPIAFTYGGWQTANYVAGEVKGQGRALAFALVVGVLTVTGLYLLVAFACEQALGPRALGATLTPAADVIGRAVGPAGARLAAAAVALSALAYLSQGMLTGPRVIFAMARDGVFFRIAGKVGETTRAPWAAVAMLAGWTGVLALSGSFERILSFVIAMNFLFFALSASTLFVLRRRGVGEGGFRAPLHPFSTGLFILACLVVVSSAFWSFPADSLIGYAILAAGVTPYLLWRAAARRALARSASAVL